MSKQIDQLRLLTKTLCKRVQDLERLQLVIDREIIEIPVDLDLVPEDDLKSY